MSERFGPRQKQSAFVLVFMLAGILYMTWRQDSQSPEAQVEQAVRAMIAGAEAGDTGPFKKHLSEQVEDQDGRNKQEILQLLTLIFFRYKDIELNVLNLDAESGTNPNMIVAELSMLMGNETLVGTERGNFVLTFRNEDEVWRVWEIDWKDGAQYGY